jgi:UDP-N-acetyl-2-amino-2-deoxyglucuronate dehydrogenase
MMSRFQSSGRMNGETPLRYAIIGGAGSIARIHIAALQRRGSTLVGLSDIDAEGVAARAAEAGCPAFVDHRAMLEAVEPDVAVICTPHPSHAPITLDCLDAGTHVLVEKPIAVEIGEGDQMVAAAEAADRILAVNFQHRLRPVIEYAKRFIDAGELGELVRVLVVEPWLRTAAYYRSATWRGSWTGEGGGVLLNQSPHTLDLLCHLVGMPAKLWGWTRTHYQAMECEDTAQAMLEYPNGAPGYFTASTAEAGGQRRIEIVGEQAAIEIVGDKLTIQRFQPPLRTFIETDPDFFSSPSIITEQLDLPASDWQGNHYAVYRDLEEAITTGRQPRCNGREGLMSLELANAITYSSLTGQPAVFPLERRAYSKLLNTLRTESGARES